MTTIVTSREFNRNPSEAKRYSLKGPVIITVRGQPAHVLLSFADYRKLTESRENIVDLLAMRPGENTAFEPVMHDFSVELADPS